MQILLIWGLVSLAMSPDLFAQYDENLDRELTVPTVFQVRNSTFSEPVHSVKVKFVRREYFEDAPPRDDFYGEYTTDSSGSFVVSLLPNKSYLLTSSKKDYSTQLSKVKTTDFSRTNQNKIILSLRPRSLFVINGQLVSDDGTPVGNDVVGTITIYNRKTGHSRTEVINADGTYSTSAVQGDDYDVFIEVADRLDEMLTITVAEQEEGEYEVESFVLKPLPKKEVAQDPNAIIIPGFSRDILSIEIDFPGKSKKLTKHALAELDTLGQILTKNPNFKINLDVHTDAINSSRLNYILAKTRVKILEKELTKRGILTEQVVMRAVGEDEILNRCVEGINCPKEEHAENNRVAISIVDTATLNSIKTQVAAAKAERDEALRKQNEERKRQRELARQAARAKKDSITAEELAKQQQKDNNQKYKRKASIAQLLKSKLEFEGKTTKPTSETVENLASMAKILKEFPDIKIKVTCHTDARKSDKFNLKLTESRAQYIQDELLNGNILGEQIELDYKGEEELINDCEDGKKCTKEQHEENNRVIVKLNK
ncbi:MAG: OmpA family protein [Aureispira sp.]|nr:OmpA family protein [Aureispira sp.]